MECCKYNRTFKHSFSHEPVIKPKPNQIFLNLPRPPRPAPRPVYGSDGRRRPELHFSWLRDPSSSDLASVAENLVGTFVNCPTDVRGGRVAEENLLAFYYSSGLGGLFGDTGVEPFTSFAMR